MDLRFDLVLKKIVIFFFSYRGPFSYPVLSKVGSPSVLAGAKFGGASARLLGWRGLAEGLPPSGFLTTCA